MKSDALQALPDAFQADFHTVEPHLRALDAHLTLRTYLTGFSLEQTEAAIWKAIRGNRALIGVVRKGGYPNVTRWFHFIEQSHPEIQNEIKAADAEAKSRIVARSRAGANYHLALENVEAGVVTRFLPEPSGYLHIGHAKAALLCDYFAHQAYDGKLRLRLDDTNPEKESEEFQDAIIEDLALMGVIPDHLSYTSDYFDHLYDTCRRMITEQHAYADDTDTETMQEERRNHIKSRCRDRSVEENLRIFDEMKTGSVEGKKNCIRAKFSYDNLNGALRDPVIYRCNTDSRHHRTGTKWKMYPTYDFACPVVDSLEGITHALRSTEYTDRNPQYKLFQDILGLRTVYMWDFARMGFIRTFLSKRKLAKLVNAGKVWGWDDPRMPTIRGVRRRGMTLPALREFILKQGPSRNVVMMDWTVFWATNKKHIDPIAPRHTGIAKKDMVHVTATGPEAPPSPYTASRPKHPKNSEIGTKPWTFSSSLLLDQADAKSFRAGEEITLMGWGNAFVRTVSTEPAGEGPIRSITCELNLSGNFQTTEKKITWLSAQGFTLTPAELWDFDYLITKDKLEEDDDMEACLNPVTESMEEVWCDQGVAEYVKDDIIQLERRGYYRVDKGMRDWKDGEEGEKGKRVVLFAIPTGKTGQSFAYTG